MSLDHSSSESAPGFFFLIAFAVFICLLVIIALYDGQISTQLKRADTLFIKIFSKAGYWLGHATILIPLLIIIIHTGVIWSKPWLKKAGASALAAFILSGITAQIIKHLVGRPRPRLAEKGVFHFGTTFESGLDSFPSGHTSTAMAVALVLSLYYPKASPLFFALAAFIAAGRLFAGSHFPSDILGGIIVGVAMGLIICNYKKSDFINEQQI